MTSYATKLTHHDGQFVARTVYVYEHWSRQEALHYFRGLKKAKDEGHMRRWWDGDTMHEELHLSGCAGGVKTCWAGVLTLPYSVLDCM